MDSPLPRKNLVYEELRKLAAAKMAQEKPGQTLQATALVHEAYVRLVDSEKSPHWDSRGHFFSAAAEAMRRILVESARPKRRLKRGGSLKKHGLEEAAVVAPQPDSDIIELDAALPKLEAKSARRAGIIFVQRLKTSSGRTLVVHQNGGETFHLRSVFDKRYTRFVVPGTYDWQILTRFGEGELRQTDGGVVEILAGDRFVFTPTGPVREHDVGGREKPEGHQSPGPPQTTQDHD